MIEGWRPTVSDVEKLRDELLLWITMAGIWSYDYVDPDNLYTVRVLPVLNKQEGRKAWSRYHYDCAK